MKGWFSKIETAEQAEKVIKEVSWSLYFLAALDFLLYGLLARQPIALIDVGLLIILAFQLRRTRSRCIALLIAAYAIYTGTMTVLARLDLYNGTGGKNIVLAGIVAVAALRGVQATLVYHRQHETKANVKGVVALSIIATALFVVVFFAVMVGAIAAGYDLQSDADSDAVGAWSLPFLALPWLLVFGRMLPFVRRLRVVKPAQT